MPWRSTIGVPNAHNQRVLDEINRRLAAASRPQAEIRYTPAEQELVDRVHGAVPVDGRECDLFCSYARIDGSAVAKGIVCHFVSGP